MRLNRGTILLLVVALVVIVGVLILNNNQAAAPGEATATPGATTVRLFEADPATVNGITVQDNLTGEATTLLRTGDTWAIQATYATDRAADPARIQTLLDSLLSLQGEGGFEAGTEDAPLDTYALNQPTHSIVVTTADTVYRLYVGGSNPAGNRYYSILRTEAAGGVSTPPVEATAEVESILLPELEGTPEVQPEFVPLVELSGAQTVYLITDTIIDDLKETIFVPPYVSPPTPTATPTNTPNPVSEVDQTATATTIFATSQAAINATATAIAQPTAEATAAP